MVIGKRLFALTTFLSIFGCLLMTSCVDHNTSSSSKKCTWGEKIQLTESNCRDHLAVDIQKSGSYANVYITTKSGIYAKFTDATAYIDITIDGTERKSMPVTMTSSSQYVGTYDSVRYAYVDSASGYIQYLEC